MSGAFKLLLIYTKLEKVFYEMEVLVGKQGVSIMKAVIGLFDNAEQVATSIDVLKRAGFAEEQIKTFKCNNPLCKLLNNYCQSYLVNNWTLFGTFFGLVHAGVLAFFISFLADRLIIFSPVVWVLLFLVLTSFGTVLGAIFGFVFGRDQWLAEKQLYRHGVQTGEPVVAVQVINEEMAAKVRLWLQDTGAMGIETLDHLPDTVLESIFFDMGNASPTVSTH